jgi:hypothetical protein
MKYLTIVLLITALNASARQYIQCAVSDSFDRAVINLDGENSTLFMTTGVHDPNEIRVLKKLRLDEVTTTHHFYISHDQNSTETLMIPNEIIGEYASSFVVNFNHERNDYQFSRDMYCYSAIYE